MLSSNSSTVAAAPRASAPVPSFVSPRWDHIANDEGYNRFLLSASEFAKLPLLRRIARDAKLAPALRVTKLELRKTPGVRPALGQVVRIVDRAVAAGETHLVSIAEMRDAADPSILFARTRTTRESRAPLPPSEPLARADAKDWAREFGPALAWQEGAVGEVVEVTVRPSDCDASGEASLTQILRLMAATELERGSQWPRADALDLLLSPKPLTTGMHVRVEFWDKGDRGSNTFTRYKLATHAGTELARVVERFSGEREDFYGKGRGVPQSPNVVRMAEKLIGARGAIPLSLHVPAEDVSASGLFHVAALNYADAASEITWCALSLSSNKRFHETGAIVMQRASRVIVHSRPRAGDRLSTESWIAQAGTSSFRMQARVRNDAGVCFEVDIVKVMVSLQTGKAAGHLFFDPAWAMQRFAGVEPVRFAPGPTRSLLASARDSVVELSSTIRHTDQDQNGHVNAANTAFLVNEARVAFMDTQPAQVRALMVPDDWAAEMYLDHQREIKMGDVVQAMCAFREGFFLCDLVANGVVACSAWIRARAVLRGAGSTIDAALRPERGEEGCDPALCVFCLFAVAVCVTDNQRTRRMHAGGEHDCSATMRVSYSLIFRGPPPAARRSPLAVARVGLPAPSKNKGRLHVFGSDHSTLSRANTRSLRDAHDQHCYRAFGRRTAAAVARTHLGTWLCSAGPRPDARAHARRPFRAGVRGAARLDQRRKRRRRVTAPVCRGRCAWTALPRVPHAAMAMHARCRRPGRHVGNN